MSLLLFFPRKKTKPIIDHYVGELRWDNIALVELISSHIIQSSFEHITVQEGYPPLRGEFVVPSISLAHRISKDRPVEIGTKKWNERRSYYLDVIGRSKGESEDLASSIIRLREKEIMTRDNRLLCLEKVIPISRISNKIPIRGRRKYHNLHFNGVNTWATFGHHSNLNTDEFGIDLDILIEGISTNQTKHIFDKYYLDPVLGLDKGYKIFISRGSGSLVFLGFHTGIGTSILQNAINFTSFLNKRIQLSCHYSQSFNSETNVYTLYSYIYINGALKSTSTRQWGLVPDRGEEDVTLGMFKTKEGLYEEGAVFDLYGFRLTSNPSRSYGKNGEYLSPSRSFDTAYFPLNEGDGTIAFNKFNTIPENLSINNHRWSKYLEEDQEFMRYSGIKLYLSTKSLID